MSVPSDVSNAHWVGTRVRCAVYVEHHRQVLLVFDPNYRGGCWILPGGAVELEETLLLAAEREVREETGLTIRINGLWRLREIVEPDPDLHGDGDTVVIRKTIEFILLGSYQAGHLRLEHSERSASGETQSLTDARWVPLDQFHSCLRGYPAYPEELFATRCHSPLPCISLHTLMLPLLDLRR